MQGWCSHTGETQDQQAGLGWQLKIKERIWVVEGGHILFVKTHVSSGLEGLGLPQAPAAPSSWARRTGLGRRASTLGRKGWARSAPAPGRPGSPPPAGPPPLSFPSSAAGPAAWGAFTGQASRRRLCGRLALGTGTPRCGGLTPAQEGAQSRQTDTRSRLKQDGAQGPAGRGPPAPFIGAEEPARKGVGKVSLPGRPVPRKLGRREVKAGDQLAVSPYSEGL